MGLFSEKFEKEERSFIKGMAERGISFEEMAEIREKYGEEFEDEETFEKFRDEIVQKLLFDIR